MPKIFQLFDLDLEEMTKLSDEDRKRLNLPRAGKILRQDLLKKGYEVLESNVSYCGIAERIIVGGEFGMKHKDDFYTLAAKLGLSFKSGDFYTQHKE